MSKSGVDMLGATAAVVLQNTTCYDASLWHAFHVQSSILIAKLFVGSPLELYELRPCFCSER